MGKWGSYQVTFQLLHIKKCSSSENGGHTDYVAVSGGFIEVRPDKVTVLSSSAEEANHIDIHRANEAKRRAEQRLQDKQAHVDFKRAEMALQRAVNRLNVSDMK